MTTIEKVKNGIIIKLAGKLDDDERKELLEKATETAFYELLEHPLCNGWESIAPEDIGALTSAPILSQDVERDDQGNILKIGKVYWFPDYMVKNEIEEILSPKGCFFSEAK